MGTQSTLFVPNQPISRQVKSLKYSFRPVFAARHPPQDRRTHGGWRRAGFVSRPCGMCSEACATDASLCAAPTAGGPV